MEKNISTGSLNWHSGTLYENEAIPCKIIVGLVTLDQFTGTPTSNGFDFRRRWPQGGLSTLEEPAPPEQFQEFPAPEGGLQDQTTETPTMAHQAVRSCTNYLRRNRTVDAAEIEEKAKEMATCMWNIFEDMRIKNKGPQYRRPFGYDSDPSDVRLGDSETDIFVQDVKLKRNGIKIFINKF